MFRYLYLLFDTNNFIHGQGLSGQLHQVASRTCFLDTGAYIFNTEAHPMDAGALDCCHGPTDRDMWQNAWFPKARSPEVSPEPSATSENSPKSSTVIEVCTNPHWQSVLLNKLPSSCPTTSAIKSWSGNRRKSSLFSLLSCEAAHFMERFCISGEVCDL